METRRSPDYAGYGYFALEPEPAYLDPPVIPESGEALTYIDENCLYESACADGVTLGQLAVSVPRAYEGGALKNYKARGVYVREDGQVRSACERAREEYFCVYDDPQLLDQTAFYHVVGEYVAGAADGQRDAIVFLHGFNVSFNDAAYRTAQIKHDTGFAGPAFFFSWPANRSVVDYLRDQDDADLSADNFVKFLEIVRASLGDGGRIHLISHSMGNRVMAQSVSLMRARGIIHPDDVTPFFDNLIIASADIDKQLFDEWTGGDMNLLARQTTVYTSSTDEAVTLSRLLRNFRGVRNGKTVKQRLGVYFGNQDEAYPAIINGAAIIDTTHSRSRYFNFLKPRFFLVRLITFGRELFNGVDHAQYIETDQMSEDLRALLQGGSGDPVARNGALYKRCQTDQGNDYYVLRGDRRRILSTCDN